MTHTYTVTGMTCGSCEAEVKSSLLVIPHVLSVDVSSKRETARIEMEKHIPLSTLQKALGGETAKYRIRAENHHESAEQAKDWISTYKPVLLIFAYILGITLTIEFTGENFRLMRWINHFMAGFFLVFSFFKLLNLQGFAESYAMYDVIAKRWKGWGYVYAFLELALGLAFMTHCYPVLTNTATLLVMAVSLVGVLQSLLSRKSIRCACLGEVFNLPMSTITVVEDGLMIVMSAIMLWWIV
jgi:cation transport ATPase